VEEADGRVEADRLERGAHVVGEQRIEERQERVDGISRRPPRTARKAQLGVADPDQVVEHGEIEVRRLTLQAAQQIDARGDLGLAGDGGEAVDRRCERRRRLGAQALQPLERRSAMFCTKNHMAVQE
jgi:hypothetical protein